VPSLDLHYPGQVNSTLLSVGLVFAFILIGGLFAAAEMALVSIRESQVSALSGTGRRGAAVARLAGQPNRFLSAVQVGVTLAGFMSAAFGGATLADDLAPWLVRTPMSRPVADVVALVLITIVISYFSIVLSELVAKRLALQRTVGIALAVAPTIDRVARISKPVIWLLSVSTDFVVRLLGGDPHAAREEMTEEELRILVASQDTLSAEERQIVDDVFDAGDRLLREVMLPRTEVDFLEADMPVYQAVKHALERPHSRYPIIGESSDDVIGFVHVRDLLAPSMQDSSVRVKDLAREVIMLPSTRGVLSALTDMRREEVHLAIVMDEYGGTDGIVTMEDLVEELIGDIRDEYDTDEPDKARSAIGSIEVDGLLNLDAFEDETAVTLPDGQYETVAGFMAAVLRRLPELGDTVQHDGFVITATELDGRRVARVRVEPLPPPAPVPAATPERTR